MIEEKVRSYLEEQLNIPVRMEEEAGLPEEYPAGRANANAARKDRGQSGELYR